MSVPSDRSGPKLKIFVEYLTYLAARGVEEAVCLIPGHRRALALGRGLGRLIFVLARDRRQVTIDNLTVAFGDELSPAEIYRLARRNFEHLGMLGIELLRLRRWSEKEMLQRLQCAEPRHFNLSTLPGSRGVFYLLSHTGSFEVLAAVCKLLGMSVHLVVTGLPNRFINERMIFSRGGADSGLKILPHRGIVRQVIELLQNGGSIGALSDQRGDDTRPVWVDFFGRKVLANGVYARFAIEGDAYCFPILGVRKDDGNYHFEFGAEIPIQRTGNMEDDIQVNSQRFHRVFEQWLREYPEQGFWMHRKFKRKPKKRRKKAK